MRGKALPTGVGGCCGRITPAYAGKSGLKGKPLLAREDHPRLCGEKFRHARWNASGRGSPPPMRGKVGMGVDESEKMGITPAYAGKRHFRHTTIPASGDHPRLCGEKFPRISHPVDSRGSPPPMRGKVIAQDRVYYSIRITPAYAGKRVTDWLRRCQCLDHPRLCGEK